MRIIGLFFWLLLIIESYINSWVKQLWQRAGTCCTRATDYIFIWHTIYIVKYTQAMWEMSPGAVQYLTHLAVPMAVMWLLEWSVAVCKRKRNKAERYHRYMMQKFGALGQRQNSEFSYINGSQVFLLVSKISPCFSS